MKAVVIGLGLAIIALLGWRFQSHPYRLDRVGQPTDQAALAHRDSSYASSSWVASEVENFLQLRFFDRVEGGVCLRPSWGDLQELAKTKPTLAHLVPSAPVLPAAGEKTWPHAWLPDPGTLTNTKYCTLFPAALLLNDRLMATPSPRDAAANVAVVGLGSGVGLAVLAHHFPQISITVIDIDQTVIDIVEAHYPLLRWLTTQTTADGRPRLRMVALDARQYIQHHGESQEPRFDAIILDAYTSGSTIPPHLMTKEFYAECARSMPADGIVLSNIIGSYKPRREGLTKHLVLGGAIRAMIDAGLTHVHNVPIIRSIGPFDEKESRNNVVLASVSDLDPRRRADAWQRVRDFVPYPELDRGNPKYITRTVALRNQGEFITAYIQADLLDLRVPRLRARLSSRDDVILGRCYTTADLSIIKEVAVEVAKAYTEQQRAIPAGWRDQHADQLLYMEYDWVDHARLTWNEAIKAARAPGQHEGDVLVNGSPARIAGKIPRFTDARPNADIYNSGD